MYAADNWENNRGKKYRNTRYLWIALPDTIQHSTVGSRAFEKLRSPKRGMVGNQIRLTRLDVLEIAASGISPKSARDRGMYTPEDPTGHQSHKHESGAMVIEDKTTVGPSGQ